MIKEETAETKGWDGDRKKNTFPAKSIYILYMIYKSHMRDV